MLAAPDACLWAAIRAVVQMVSADPQVRHQNRRVLPIATDMAVPLVLPASDGSVDPDAVHLAADLPDLCSEAVRDFHP